MIPEPVLYRTFLWICCFHVIGIESIILLDLQIPPYVKQGEDVKLICVYDLEYDGLYSVKWYKDDKEFYRYVPRMETPKRFYKLPGLDIDSTQTDHRQVLLRNVSLESTGEVKCQISGEGPLFATHEESKDLRVAVVPSGPPSIVPSPVSIRFSPGDWLNLNCTSEPSVPTPRISWIVNGAEADYDWVLRHRPQPSSSTVTVALQFWVHEGHFASTGKLTVQCRAYIPAVYRAQTPVFTVGEYSVPQRVLSARSRAGKSTAPEQELLYVALFAFVVLIHGAPE